MLDNLDWSADDPLEKMYAPAASIVRRKGLDVWANGPHVQKNGSIGPANATAWRPYLELASFTTLFEVGVETWLAPSWVKLNYSAALQWPVSRLGGYVSGLPENSTTSAIEASLQKAIDRGLSWLYPTVACKHAQGPHQGSCTYAELPSYWPELVDAVEKLNL